MIGGGNEAVPEQISDLLGGRPVGIEPGGKGMTQAVRAEPANKPAATIGSIHSRGYRPRGQGPSPQQGLPDKQLFGIRVRSMMKIVAQGARHVGR